MQHKRQHNRAVLKLLLAALVLVVGVGALMAASPQAPIQPVEKQLDAKTFLGAKE